MRDEWYIKSSVLSMVSDSISVYGEEHSEVQEKLLHCHMVLRCISMDLTRKPELWRKTMSEYNIARMLEFG